ncbi:hypothetical protein ACLMJK_001337 [Lecanora helva]
MDAVKPSKSVATFLGLIGLSTASLLPNDFRFESSFQTLSKRADAWPYGVIGDSWGSGVSYNDDVLYDGNRDNCLRTKESHGPQMEADPNWAGHDPSGLRDAACSGSQLVDIVLGQHQMGKVGNPDVVIMTSGGNNAGFGHIVDVCIYHSDPTHNYGNPYWSDKDGSGECAKALADATGYITDPNRMAKDLTNTLDDLFKDPAVSNNPDFLLYLTGYAQFFGTDYDPWCEYEYWSIPTINPFNIDPYLSKTLRQAFNDRVTAVNNLYKTTAESDAYKSKVRYIDIDAGFSGHRFCEPGSNYKEQINTDTHFDKVYLWNLNYPWQITGQGAPSAAAASGNVSAQEAQDAFAGQGVTAWSSGGGGNDPKNGWRLRPFHPRYTGYTAIKEAIFAQLKVDGLPKAAGASSPSVTCYHAADPQNTCAAIANGAGWCDCGDDNKYIIEPSGQPCAWTTKPATTSFDCAATPAPPPPSSAAPAPSPTPSVDLNSPDCQTCTGNLGASDCKPDDDQCLVDQCNNDTSCQKCKIDCSSFGNI